MVLPSTPVTVASLASSTETLPRAPMAAPVLAAIGASNNTSLNIFGQPWRQEATPPKGPPRSPRVAVPVQTLQSAAPPASDARAAGRLTPPPSWTPDPGPAAQNGMWNGAGASLEGKPDFTWGWAEQSQQRAYNDMNGRMPSLAAVAPGALWNAGSILSETKIDLNATGYNPGSSRPPEGSGLGSALPTAGFGGPGIGLPNMQSTVSHNAAATAPTGGNGLIGSMLGYPSPFSQAAAVLGSSSVLENGGGMQASGVEQVVFYGISLPFYSEQQLQAMNSLQLREQANLLFKTIGAERIGTIIPPLDNDLLTWVRWVQMVHLDPLRRARGEVSTC
mmetsp:Transcript_143123/g.266761  ORF Transcript_143123/g.266761 Transcript_143123/m.266761 type:complete len:334 (-) Transcript_143123:70-1071(-)